ncbi:MAG: rane protein, major facilitator superfamily [Firmicutes bacterium]|nr:rane protein, major facilitator superfamily [Bacillota bacterium]
MLSKKQGLQEVEREQSVVNCLSGTIYYEGWYLVVKAYFKWLVLLAVSLGAFVAGMNTIAVAPILGDMAQDLGISIPAAQASFLGIFVFVVSIATLISGALADRFGMMPVLVIAAFMSIVANLLYPFVGETFILVVLMRILQGAAAGAIFSLISLCAAHWFSEHQRGLIIGIGMTMLNAGMAAGIFFSPLVFEAVGNWRSTLSWLGVGQLVLLVYIVIIAFNYKANEPSQTKEESGKAETSSWDSLKGAFKQPTTYIGIILCLCISWLLNALNDLTPQYFALDAPVGVGFGRMAAGSLMLIVQIGTILGGLVGGFVMDKVFKSNPKPVLLIGFIICAVTIYAILFPAVYNNSPLLMGALFLAGLAVAFLNPAAAVFISQAYPEKIIGRVVGLWLGIGAFGGALGVFAGALALHSTGTFHLTITMFAGVCVLGMILSQLLKKNITAC